ncbi:hypothetical protein D3C84_1249300 [compost metagenome]
MIRSTTTFKPKTIGRKKITLANPRPLNFTFTRIAQNKLKITMTGVFMKMLIFSSVNTRRNV